MATPSLKVLSAEQIQAKQRVQQLNQELKNETIQLQHNLMNKLSLKQRIEQCMTQKCLELSKQSEEIINEEITKRKEQEAQNPSYTLDKAHYLSTRYFSLDRSLTVERAETCLNECQRPSEIIKRVLTQNFKEVQENIQHCCKDCEVINQESNSREINYQCVSKCLETNISILKDVDKILCDEFVSRADLLFF
ncbi:UNKNOWN [Stylonychia lemnae]|uniref:Uncharacterized protein n=1 Tax=Stylonychia lemnae TaxID=5949 RepID=A0A078A0E4_STYLE|nr:UNKNOWN [Stylonychia lemnae]|eukprot:CDW75620.1 UNKNOWN [Stylonychia lemnae]